MEDWLTQASTDAQKTQGEIDLTYTSFFKWLGLDW